MRRGDKGTDEMRRNIKREQTKQTRGEIRRVQKRRNEQRRK